MFTYPFEILKARLIESVTELREVDLYMDQDNVKDKDAWLKAAPAAFINFYPVDLSNLGNKIQSGKVNFEIILITDTIFDTGSKRLKKDTPRDHMRLFDAINNCIHGYSAMLSILPDHVALKGTSKDQRVMNTISRVSIPLPPQKPLKALMKSIQKFECMMWDHSRFEEYTSVNPKPALEIQVEL